MRSTEFAYWLQGFFELSNPETITKEQVVLIERHMKLVEKYEKKPDVFWHWLDGFLQGKRKDSLFASSIDAEGTNLIKKKLAGLFKHEIDLSYGLNNSLQEQMNNIHSGGNSDPSKVVMRC